MCPSGSDRRGGSRAASAAQAGFTLVELLITMVVAVILGMGLVRFYKDSYHAYSMQDQIADRNQNAHFTLGRMVEVLQQAGSSLPDTGWPVIIMSGGKMTIGINPRGAEQYNSFDLPSSNFVPVTDGSKFAASGNVFLNTTHVLVLYADPAKAVQKFALDVGYNGGGFSAGVKDNPTGLDSIRLLSSIALSAGDRIYGYREDQYSLTAAGNLIICPNGNSSAQMVLSENIDSLGLTFLDAGGGVTSSWKKMRSASITVRARTEIPDPKLPPPGYRKITLPMNILLRNKI